VLYITEEAVGWRLDSNGVLGRGPLGDSGDGVEPVLAFMFLGESFDPPGGQRSGRGGRGWDGSLRGDHGGGSRDRSQGLRERLLLRLLRRGWRRRGRSQGAGRHPRDRQGNAGDTLRVTSTEGGLCSSPVLPHEGSRSRGSGFGQRRGAG
jgi:hypothetical protein